MMRIHVCNNDKYGNWTNRISRFEFEVHGETAMRLETKSMFPITVPCFDDVSFLVQRLEMYGIYIKVSLVGTWTGNMMWNTIETLDYYALGLIRALQLSGEWACG